jgi:hypothetical protein
MALLPDNTPTRDTEAEVIARFGIAQDSRPTQAQLEYQRVLRGEIATIAAEINADVADSREKSLALTALEEALMWAGKAIFK